MDWELGGSVALLDTFLPSCRRILQSLIHSSSRSDYSMDGQPRTRGYLDGEDIMVTMNTK
jgi:hypothetical protein